MSLAGGLGWPALWGCVATAPGTKTDFILQGGAPRANRRHTALSAGRLLPPDVLQAPAVMFVGGSWSLPHLRRALISRMCPCEVRSLCQDLAHQGSGGVVWAPETQGCFPENFQKDSQRLKGLLLLPSAQAVRNGSIHHAASRDVRGGEDGAPYSQNGIPLRSSGH